MKNENEGANRNVKRGFPIASLCVFAAAALVFAALLSPAAVTGLAGRTNFPFYRGSGGNGVSLVIAVAWEPAALDSLLDVLDECGAEASFAVTPDLIERTPELVRGIASRGHDVDLLWLRGAPSAEQLGDTAVRLEAVTGKAPKAVLCESESAEKTAKAAQRLGMTALVGSVDLRPVGDDRVTLRKKAASFAFGSCVFIAEPTPALADELADFVNSLKNMGFDIVSFHKMLYN